MAPTLSVLICSIKERAPMLRRLMNSLEDQLGKAPALVPRVEILVEVDDHRSERRMNIGGKRQLLLHRSKHDYVCFIDDDDKVTPSYFPCLLKAIEKEPDVVGITGYRSRNGRGLLKFFQTLRCTGAWYTDTAGFWRTPNHLNPIKRDIALEVGFPDINYGEDKRFSDVLTERKLLKTEEFVSTPIYHYDFNISVSRSRLPVVRHRPAT